MEDTFGCRVPFTPASGPAGTLYSLPRLEQSGVAKGSRLPVCLRIVLESLLRNCDGVRVREEDVRKLAGWKANEARTAEIPFVVARVLLQDFTGVPLLVDLAAMRSAVARMKKDPLTIQPLVPVDLVIDHSIQVDVSRAPNALALNMELEFKRNRARYEFLKWGMQAFDGLGIVPPGVGIVHQVNLEYLAKGVLERQGVHYPDSLVGTDSHTPMINGLGVVGWGVGGIEAEAGMLGQPVYFLTPDVVGVHVEGAVREGVTATDVVLHVTEMLRKAKVVGKFVEFFGDGAATLPVPERATISNMSPEYGATMGFFPVDEATLRYYRSTGRSEAHVETLRRYYQAQGMFGIPKPGECDYSTTVELDLAAVRPSVSGPKRPQDRIDLESLKGRFRELLGRKDATGYGKPVDEIDRLYATHGESPRMPLIGGGQQDSETVPEGAVTSRDTSGVTEREMMNNRPTPDTMDEVPEDELPPDHFQVRHGDVLIAAITSCTNTSNPSVMLAAGLLASKAVERGLRVGRTVKTSLAPGSRVVTEYLQRTGLQEPLDRLGFHLVGYGCTSCIGNCGPLDPRIEDLVGQNDIVAAAVLSGNRNFEARVHQSIKANFLMSPPLVVAFAIAGRVDIDLTTEPLGTDKDGRPVYLRDIWPSSAEVEALAAAALDPETYRRLYGRESMRNELWDAIPVAPGTLYRWDPESTYIQEPPYFIPFEMTPEARGSMEGARALAIFGDSVTTDHISPAGAIKPSSPAGEFLIERGIKREDFNSYGARRGNHHVMVRGTFANVRIKNLMVPGAEGGVTVHHPSGARMTIHEAAMEYQKTRTPLLVIAGQEYGSGSSRDWAAKGARLLGVAAVVARSYERIHRSNLVGMGVLPCQFEEGVSAQTLGLDGTETYDLVGLEKLRPRQEARLVVHGKSNSREVPVTVRIDTPIEVDYYLHGGILPYVLRKLLG
ncbi:MAG: aconitate hydratase [Deltaproteobacteria bacterium]|nr:aconitate hydratase [Deltaproteobacteria bacterium]